MKVEILNGFGACEVLATFEGNEYTSAMGVARIQAVRLIRENDLSKVVVWCNGFRQFAVVNNRDHNPEQPVYVTS